MKRLGQFIMFIYRHKIKELWDGKHSNIDWYDYKYMCDYLDKEKKEN